MDDAVGELAHDVENARSYDLIERILDESPEPPPEEPVQLGHDEEGDKHRAEEYAQGGCHQAKGYNDESERFGNDGSQPQERIEEDRDRLRDRWGVEVTKDVGRVIGNPLCV